VDDGEGVDARRTGLAAIVIGGLAAGLGAYAFLSLTVAVLALAAAGLVLGAVRGLAMRKIGGQTGDVCGTAQVMTETAMLAVFAAAILGA
jgi:adenosylcobinamide-GDP ribazoletransferase